MRHMTGSCRSLWASVLCCQMLICGSYLADQADADVHMQPVQKAAGLPSLQTGNKLGSTMRMQSTMPVPKY